MNDLVELFERQVTYVQAQTGDRLFVALPRFVEFLTNEPRLAAVIEDLTREYEVDRLVYARADDDLAAAFELLWREHQQWFSAEWERQLAANPTNKAMRSFGHPSDVHTLLGCPRRGAEKGISFGLESSRLEDACNRMDTMWSPSLVEDLPKGEARTRLKAFHREYSNIKDRSDAERRRREFIERTHPGAAWRRLRWAAERICPPHVQRVSLSQANLFEEVASLVAEMEGRDLSNVALGRDVRKSDVFDAKAKREILADDLETLRQELVRRIGLHLSHLALVNRFKTKCERFRSAELRDRCTVTARSAEKALTLAAAEYLFDQGLNPLFNPQLVKLRPDLFDSALPHALYIEAKQYGEGEIPKRLIKEAAWQVWDTWSELDAQHKVKEAFLVVFRRAGPLLVFEGPARFHGRTMHPILVDIAPTNEKGSRQKNQPVKISIQELLPREEDGGSPARANRSRPSKDR
jgi:hypothetical protein